MLRVFSEGSLHLEDAVAKRNLLFPKSAEIVIPLFFEDSLFFEDVLGSILLFYKDGGGSKKGDASPFFYFFMDCVFREFL